MSFHNFYLIVKSHCTHANYIEPQDYPHKLPSLSEEYGIDFRLDIEAKAKDHAIFKLENRTLILANSNILDTRGC